MEAAEITRQSRARHDAKIRAGYGSDDTPCEPRRSAYSDGPAGTAAHATAIQKWYGYLDLCDMWDVQA